MKKRTKLTFAGIVTVGVAILLSGCTASFCSKDDKAHILYAFDYGVSDYYAAGDANKPAGAEKIWDTNDKVYFTTVIPTSTSSGLGKTNSDAAKSYIKVPTTTYFKAMDKLVLEAALKTEKGDTFDFSTATYDDVINALDKHGYLKYAGEGNNKLWNNWDALNQNLRDLSIDGILNSRLLNIVAGKVLAENLPEEDLSRIIAVTYTDNYPNSFDLDITAASENNVYFYSASSVNYPNVKIGFDDWSSYLKQINPGSLNGTVNLSKETISETEIETEKYGKWVVSTDDTNEKHISGYYFENNEYRVYQKVAITENVDPFTSDAKQIFKSNKQEDAFGYAFYQKMSAGIVLDDLPTNDWINLYKKDMNGLISSYRSCIAISADKYGYYGYAGGAQYRTNEIIDAKNGKIAVTIQAKDWGYAWKKGFLEGLLVFPIAWLTETFVSGFKSAGVMGGLAQLLAIFLITFIVRSLMLLVTFKQTSSNAKMQALQPEITKIQNKYPNANSNTYEKQQMAAEMNKLYKKNKINPLGSLLVMIVQFPVFICVWGALQGCASLSSDSFLNLHLSDAISGVLFNSANWANGSAITALVLFLLMAGAQVISMLLPQWIQKKKRKQVASLGKNPAQNDQQSKMKMFTYIMMAMIIFMGFTLPSAMGVYWFVGALFSICQTLIFEKINSAKAKKKGR